ncbi:MAG TPA: hypothetical protein VGJ33_11470 [Candidatus Angelobacter sp.]
MKPFDQRGVDRALLKSELLVSIFSATTIPFRRNAVFWTIFTVAILLWMLGLAANFGADVMPLLLVLGTILALMNFAFRRRTPLT